jgi:hypothetical protein
MSAPDFLPLTPGLRLEYALTRGAEESALAVENLAAPGGGVLVRRTETGPGGDARTETGLAERRDDGVYVGGALVLPLPPRVGAEWSRPPRSYRVEALDARAETPAGDFAGCLRVGYLIAGGDGGCGERFYAPDVGLVRERCGDEASPFEAALTAVRRAGAAG